MFQAFLYIKCLRTKNRTVIWMACWISVLLPKIASRINVKKSVRFKLMAYFLRTWQSGGKKLEKTGKRHRSRAAFSSVSPFGATKWGTLRNRVLFGVVCLSYLQTTVIAFIPRIERRTGREDSRFLGFVMDRRLANLIHVSAKMSYQSTWIRTRGEGYWVVINTTWPTHWQAREKQWNIMHISKMNSAFMSWRGLEALQC